MKVEKYWNDLLQVLTEDENLRIRKGDMNELLRSDIKDFYQHIRLFEDRMEEKIQKLEEQKVKHGKG